ncbi:histidine-type phosphatase [Fibrobacter sp.]|uniref:histidine-type phosphatase n=1 Tax=Fibrobacter sp. TaxID=35828 RepID=UPI00388EF96F
MKYKFLGIFAIGAMLATTATAQTTDEELRAHPEYTNSNYLLYPEPTNVKYAKAPAGYKAFYLSHYGRHGSRYNHSDEDYKYLFGTLSKADSLGKLTEVGKQALAYTHVLFTKAAPRAGDLTQVGVKQHQGIAKRMAKNFPEIFNGKNAKTPHIKAYASTSGRCIVSMSAFLGEFRAQFPKVEVEMVSGKSYMPSICPFDWGKLQYSELKSYTDESGKLWNSVNPKPFMAKLFNDTAYVAKNIDASKFFNRFIEIASQNPGLDESVLEDIANEAKVPAETFLNLFTTEEKITRWKAQNSWWYSLLGTSPLIGVQDGINFGKGILKSILDEADTVIAADTLKADAKNAIADKNAAQSSAQAANAKSARPPVVATLRFGHDTGLLPLAALMQLPVANAKVSDLSKLHEQWTDFRVIPMAANMQIVFYKSTKAAKPAKGAAKSASAKKASSSKTANKTAPILVKLLYNEIEQTLPIECGLPETEKKDCPVAPYYRWDDFRAFYSNLLK